MVHGLSIIVYQPRSTVCRPRSVVRSDPSHQEGTGQGDDHEEDPDEDCELEERLLEPAPRPEDTGLGPECAARPSAFDLKENDRGQDDGDEDLDDLKGSW